MISEDDARRSYVFEDHYVIAPMLKSWTKSPLFTNGQLVPEGFSYRSDTNDQWLSVDEIRNLADKFS